MLYWSSDLDYLERPKQKKMDMKFGTWNVKDLCRAGSLTTMQDN